MPFLTTSCNIFCCAVSGAALQEACSGDDKNCPAGAVSPFWPFLAYCGLLLALRSFCTNTEGKEGMQLFLLCWHALVECRFGRGDSSDASACRRLQLLCFDASTQMHVSPYLSSRQAVHARLMIVVRYISASAACTLASAFETVLWSAVV